MRELLEYVLSGIIEETGYTIEEETESGSVNFLVHAGDDVIGLIIGKNGRTVRAIRNLLRVRATLENKVVNLNVIEAESKSSVN